MNVYTYQTHICYNKNINVCIKYQNYIFWEINQFSIIIFMQINKGENMKRIVVITLLSLMLLQNNHLSAVQIDSSSPKLPTEFTKSIMKHILQNIDKGEL